MGRRRRETNLELELANAGATQKGADAGLLIRAETIQQGARELACSQGENLGSTALKFDIKELSELKTLVTTCHLLLGQVESRLLSLSR